MFAGALWYSPCPSLARNSSLISSHACLQPKHPNSDAWDYAMEERDRRLREEAKKSPAT